MSSKQSARKLNEPNNCCVKDSEEPGTKSVKPIEPSQLSVYDKECSHIEKPKKATNVSDELEAKNCNRPRNYRTPAEKRLFLEQKVTPVLLEGMLGLARDQPDDPISYLEGYWLREQHKCNINTTQNSI